MLGVWFPITEEVNTNVHHWYLSDISSSWPSFIHITWTLASDTSHSKVALFFSVIFRSFSCLVNSITRAAARGETTRQPRYQNLMMAMLSTWLSQLRRSPQPSGDD